MKVYLVCGVPGSGKTWVCNQLTESFTYVPHDDDLKSPHRRAMLKARLYCAERIPLTDCPFAERELRLSLEAFGFIVKPYFIIEHPDICAARYFTREGKQLAKSSLTRAVTILQRAREWNAPCGTSEEILALLKSEARHGKEKERTDRSPEAQAGDVEPSV